MFGEPYDGLLVGGVLTLVTSVIILLFTNRSTEKQWLMQKTFEAEDRAIEEVYSPLYFILWDLFTNFAYLSGLICATAEREHISAETLPSCFNEYKCEGKLSKNIRETLISKLGLVNPKGLRDDLFYFFKHVESFENELFYLGTEEPETIKNKLSLYSWVADFSGAIGNTLSERVKHHIDQKRGETKNEPYKQIFDIKVAAELQAFLLDKPTAGRVLEFKEWASKYKESISSSSPMSEP